MANASGAYVRPLNPLSSQVTANWNSGTATSGGAGGNLVTLGVAGLSRLFHSLVIDIANLAVGATITIRLYRTVNGVERECYNQTFTQGTDPNGCWVIDGTLSVRGTLRVEVNSNNAADDGVAIGYQCEEEFV